MLDKNFLNVTDVSKYIDISVPMAYKVIRKLNDELNEQGFLTISGKVSKLYFEQKVFGIRITQGGGKHASL